MQDTHKFSASKGALADKLRLIAFYLPQYHPIAENDEWWGRGFTEWKNVARARPLYAGHHQPHIPADLGFYDLRLTEARVAQAQLAAQYGISGFCYYHYWFNGRRILDRPFNEVLASGAPDFPFCLCWANENWTRTWDGSEQHILMGQNYGDEDDKNHIRSLIPAFMDSRYIRIDGKPLFLVYRTELMPDPKRTADVWRDECRQAGVGEIYLARVENFVRAVDPAVIGFDAAVEFAPDTSSGSAGVIQGTWQRLLNRAGLLPPVFERERVISYESVARAMAGRPPMAYTRFRCVMPMWDNTARRGLRATIYAGSTPALYEQWLSRVVDKTMQERSGQERITFVNAWNEWGEGCHLEPDLRWGRDFLEATQRALMPSSGVSQPQGQAPSAVAGSQLATAGLRQHFWAAHARLGRALELLRQVAFRIGSDIVARCERH